MNKESENKKIVILIKDEGGDLLKTILLSIEDIGHFPNCPDCYEIAESYMWDNYGCKYSFETFEVDEFVALSP